MIGKIRIADEVAKVLRVLSDLLLLFLFSLNHDSYEGAFDQRGIYLGGGLIIAFVFTNKNKGRNCF